MVDAKLKFVLYDGELRLARVTMHKHLLPDNYDRSRVQGGGEFRVDRETQQLTVWGKSYDFGPFDREAVLTARLPQRLKEYTVVVVDGPPPFAAAQSDPIGD